MLQYKLYNNNNYVIYVRYNSSSSSNIARFVGLDGYDDVSKKDSLSTNAKLDKVFFLVRENNYNVTHGEFYTIFWKRIVLKFWLF